MSDIPQMYKPDLPNLLKVAMKESCWFHQAGTPPWASRLAHFPTKISAWVKTKLADISEGIVSV